MARAKGVSLRKATNAKCKSCIYDDLAAGTWRQQVTLCSVDLCPSWNVRPTTSSPIPDSVLRFYEVEPGEYQAIVDEIRQSPESSMGEEDEF